MRKKILVTGANGQLGMELQQLAKAYTLFEFIFTTREEMPLDNPEAITNFIAKQQPQYFINCAAHTAVDKAESEKELAYQINAEAPGTIAKACKENNVQLIHISTDYVFNGTGSVPYKEEDATDPVNLYGDSKLQGEKKVMEFNPGSIIIRTAWVYSEFGKNFVKTMLRLMADKDQMGVVSDQSGTPTYAADLAEAILQIISSQQWTAGIYHFSNEGNITWYDFAVAIKELSGSNCKVNPIITSQFPTPAKRPSYSVLDKTKIQRMFNIPPKDWKASLSICLQKLKG
ncbi:MAG: dTDP-4-dehydrorhamnose reductase [Chitinophagaceae bacterium]